MTEELDLIGYVPLDENGDVHRPIKNENHRWRKPVKSLARIYQTGNRARPQSPVGLVAEVYIKRVHEDG